MLSILSVSYADDYFCYNISMLPVWPQVEAEGQASTTGDVLSASISQQQQPVAMVTDDGEDGNDGDSAPPDYDDPTDSAYHRRLSTLIRAEMRRTEASGSTLASNAATEGSSLFSVSLHSLVGCIPVPPPYSSTTGTGTYIITCFIFHDTFPNDMSVRIN